MLYGKLVSTSEDSKKAKKGKKEKKMFCANGAQCRLAFLIVNSLMFNSLW